MDFIRCLSSQSPLEILDIVEETSCYYEGHGPTDVQTLFEWLALHHPATLRVIELHAFTVDPESCTLHGTSFTHLESLSLWMNARVIVSVQSIVTPLCSQPLRSRAWRGSSLRIRH